MQINVTQEHINQGQRKCQNNCPISLALIDCGFRYPETYYRAFKAAPPNEKVPREIALPEEATVFIKQYDEGSDVEPFSFALEVPPCK